MISFNRNDVYLAGHASEVMQDFYLERDGGYTEADYESAKKLGKIGRGLLVTGEELDEDAADELMTEVVRAELDHWIPDASQRLINRAATILGFGMLLDPMLEPDHGSKPEDHALALDWLHGIYVLRCCTCAHLFKV